MPLGHKEQISCYIWTHQCLINLRLEANNNQYIHVKGRLFNAFNHSSLMFDFGCPGLEAAVCRGLAVQLNTDEAFRFLHWDQTDVPGRGEG